MRGGWQKVAQLAIKPIFSRHQPRQVGSRLPAFAEPLTIVFSCKLMQGTVQSPANGIACFPHKQPFELQLAVGLKHHQRRAIGFGELGGNKGHKLKNMVKVVEGPQGKAQRAQKFLILAVLATEFDEQIGQQGRCAHTLCQGLEA